MNQANRESFISQKLAHFDRAMARYSEQANVSDTISIKTQDFDFRNYYQNVQVVLNIGVGSGLELIALHNLYGMTGRAILGIDLSSMSILSAKKLLAKNNSPLERFGFLVGDATSTPFLDRSIDIILMNSLLHEVFSYSVNGVQNWKAAIEEGYRILRPGGLLYIEDFAPPKNRTRVIIELKTQLAREFYDFFRTEYRAFSSWGDETIKLFTPIRIEILSGFPELQLHTTSLELCSDLALELLTHFSIFMNDLSSGLSSIGDRNWVEINEQYHLRLSSKAYQYGIEGYLNEITSVVNSPSAIDIVEAHITERPNFTIGLYENLSAQTIDGEDFIPYAAKKMRLLLRRSP